MTIIAQGVTRPGGDSFTAIHAKILADSTDGLNRITTFACVVPKTLDRDFNTHGMVRRNAASARAIPTVAIVERVLKDPFIPPVWYYRQKGMDPGQPMTPEDAAKATAAWLGARDAILPYVRDLEAIRCSKEEVNRLLEAHMWTTIIATATEWDNFFTLRRGGSASFRVLVASMEAAFSRSKPVYRHPKMNVREHWHLPLVTDDERYDRSIDVRVLPALSARRIAKVSYFRQDEPEGLAHALARYFDLTEKGHWSPVEQPSMCGPETKLRYWHGPFRGFIPLRKMYAGESGSKHHGTHKDVKPWAIHRSDLPQLLLQEGV